MKNYPQTDDLVEALCFVDPEYKNGIELKPIEERFNCDISWSTQKHSELQHTHFYDVDFGIDENFYVEIESGINNGTQVNSSEWGVNTVRKTQIVSVLTDIVLDMAFYEVGSHSHRKAEAVLNANKSKLFDFHRKNDYDNYVTGGNSKLKMDASLSFLNDLNLRYIYEEKEVDCIFI